MNKCSEDVGRTAVWKSLWIILPTCIMTGMIAYIDRSNLAYAAPTVKRVVGIDNSQYGFASGILYLSYCFFQVPSQLVVRKIGAPIWLGILVVLWGIVAASLAAVKTVGQFYAVRVLLGACEAGTFPALYYHLSLFFTDRELSLAYSFMLTSLSLSQVIGGPIAGGLQYLEGKKGLHGYQWLFIIEGCLTVVWGVALPFLLPKSPQTTRLLKAEERTWLAERQTRLGEIARRDYPAKGHVLRIFFQWQSWYYAAMCFLVQAILAGCIFFVPLIVDAMFSGDFNGVNPTTKIPSLAALRWQVLKVSLISAILYFITLFATISIGWSSKRFTERNWHCCLGLLAAGIAFMCVPITLDQRGAVSAFAVMCLAAAGSFGVIGPLLSWVIILLHGFARDIAFGLFNAIGGVGAFSGPTIIGKLSNEGGWQSSMYFLGACCIASGFMALFFKPGSITAAAAADYTISSEDKLSKAELPANKC